MEIQVYYHEHEMDRPKVVDFLYEHLDEYRDNKEQIRNAIDYAMDSAEGKGGFVLIGTEGDQIMGCVVINDTAMEGYIPQHILVYVAVHKNQRGKGIGRKLIQKTVEVCAGNIALHVEYDNPARLLYQKLGFRSKYAEMRYEQLDDQHRIQEMKNRIQKRLKAKKENTLRALEAFRDSSQQPDEQVQREVEDTLFAIVEKMTDWELTLNEEFEPLTTICRSFRHLITLYYSEQVLLNRVKTEWYQSIERVLESSDWEYMWEEYGRLKKAVRMVKREEDSQ